MGRKSNEVQRQASDKLRLGLDPNTGAPLGTVIHFEAQQDVADLVVCLTYEGAASSHFWHISRAGKAWRT